MTAALVVSDLFSYNVWEVTNTQKQWTHCHAPRTIQIEDKQLPLFGLMYLYICIGCIGGSHCDSVDLVVYMIFACFGHYLQEI